MPRGYGEGRLGVDCRLSLGLARGARLRRDRPLCRATVRLRRLEIRAGLCSDAETAAVCVTPVMASNCEGDWEIPAALRLGLKGSCVVPTYGFWAT
jgi:hypothetical protein